MSMYTRLRDLRKNKRGATLVEFGIVAGPMLVIIMGIFDLGYQSYLGTLSKGVLHRVARQASSGTMNPAQIEIFVKDKLDTVTMDGTTVTVEAKSYFDFTNIGKPEKLVLDANGDNFLDIGDCYLDGNSSGTFDVDHGTVGTGGPDDIVTYDIKITAPRLFPIAKWAGLTERMTLQTSTAVRNQPFGAKKELVKICRTV